MTDNRHLFVETFNRFDDHLFDIILSYLSFSDKVSYECVSKRFQRSVQTIQTSLELHSWVDADSIDNLYKLTEPIVVTDFITGAANGYNYRCVSKNSLILMLKKYANIENIKLVVFTDYEVLEIIGKYCPKLRRLEFDTIGLSMDDLFRFGDKYGNRLKQLDIDSRSYGHLYLDKLLCHCKQLELFKTSLFEFKGLNYITDSNNSYLPSLRSIADVMVNQSDDIPVFHKFCTKYCQQLHRLDTFLSHKINDNEFDNYLQSLSKFKCLKRLQTMFDAIDDNDMTFMSNFICKLSQTSTQLQYFDLFISGCNLNNSDKILQSFQSFSNVKHFEFNFQDYSENKQTIQSDSQFVDCFKSMSNSLKYFKFTTNLITNENFFINIDNYLPKLSTLIIESETEFTDQTISYISGLKYLQTFQLNAWTLNHKLITDTSVCQLINCCKRIELISFSGRPLISYKTIDALILCANSFPKKTLDFQTGFENEENVNEFPEIDLTVYDNQIPSNLTVNIETG